MKKSIIKSATSLILCVGVLLSAMIFSANAESKSTVQKWDFTKFEDISHAKGDEYGAILSKDGNISTGVKEGEKYWNKFHVLDIKDGKLNQEDYNYSASHREFIVNFKLTDDLKSGQKYIFKSDIKTTGDWVRPALYYTADVSNSVNGTSNDDVNIPAGAIKLYQFETKGDVTSTQLNNFTVEIAPTEDLKAGGWLNLRYKTGGRTVTTSISSAELYKTAKETPVANAWDFSKFDNISHAKGDEYGAILSKDGNISTGVKEGEKYWNKFHVLDIKDGKLNQEDYNYSASHREFIVNFKLTDDLKSGQKYIFKSDIKTTGDWVRPALYYTADVSNSVNGTSNDDVNIPAGAIKLYQFETKGDVTSTQLNNFTVEIAPTEDLKAGGWLNLRYKTGGRNVTTTISKAAIIENTDETLVSNSISLLNGAQVRYDEPTGLRFVTNVNTSVETELTSLGATDIKYGTLIVPKDYLADTEFTKKAFADKNKTILDIEYTGDKAQKGEGENTYFEMKAAIVNIKTGNYKREFVARAYVTYKIGETEYTTYSDYNLVDNSRSVNFVANKLINDKTEFEKLSNERQENVRNFAN